MYHVILYNTKSGISNIIIAFSFIIYYNIINYNDYWYFKLITMILQINHKENSGRIIVILILYLKYISFDLSINLRDSLVESAMDGISVYIKENV